MIGPDEQPHPVPLDVELGIARELHVLADRLGDEVLHVMVEELEVALEDGRLNTALSINRQVMDRVSELQEIYRVFRPNRRGLAD